MAIPSYTYDLTTYNDCTNIKLWSTANVNIDKFVDGIRGT